MLAVVQQREAIGLSTEGLRVSAARYLPMNPACGEGEIVAWVGPVEARIWGLLEQLAPQPQQKRRILAAALEALLYRYSGAWTPAELRLRFVDLLAEDGVLRRFRHSLAEGAGFRVALETLPETDLSSDLAPDLSLVYVEGASQCAWRYREAAWKLGHVERFHAHYWKLLSCLLEKPDAPIGQHDYLTDIEREALLGPWSGVTEPHADPGSLCSVFEEMAAIYSDEVALVDGQRHEKFRQLNRDANQLAHYLMYYSVRPASVVGVCLPSSYDMVVAYLAVLKLGAVLLPLDPAESAEQRSAKLQATGCTLLLTRGQEIREGDCRCLDLVQEVAAIASQPASNPGIRVRGDQAAAIVFRSGKHGALQSVLLLHRNILSLARETEYLDLGAKDVLLQMSRQGSIEACFELFAALLNGARAILHPWGAALDPRRLADLLRKHKVTTLYLSPGHLQLCLAEIPEALASVEHLIAGGAPLPRKLRLAAQACRGKRPWIEAFGAAESSPFALLQRWRRGDAVDSRYLGHVRQGMGVYLLDPAGALVPIGVPGEICFEGVGVAWGHLEDCEAGEERFVCQDLHPGRGGRLFRSGALARWTDEGQLEFLGFQDRLARLDGNRLDLNAIERALLHFPEIEDCVVVVRELAGGIKRLLAYVVLANGPVPQMRRLFRERLAQRLPEALLPHDFIPLAELPYTVDGLVERSVLETPVSGPEVSGAEADARAAERQAAAAQSHQRARASQPSSSWLALVRRALGRVV